MSESDAGVGGTVPQELVSRVRKKVAMTRCLRMVGINYMQFVKARPFWLPLPGGVFLCVGNWDVAGKALRENRSSVGAKTLMQAHDVYSQSLYHQVNPRGWLLSSQESNSAFRQVRRTSELYIGFRLTIYLSNTNMEGGGWL